MTAPEVIEHYSRYLAESRVRTLSNEERRAMEEMKTRVFEVKLDADGDVYTIQPLNLQPLEREFGRMI